MMKMFVQRLNVWCWTKLFGPTPILEGIDLIDSRAESKEEMAERVEHVRQAMQLIEISDHKEFESVKQSLQMIIVTSYLDKLMSPYGAYFIPESSRIWQSERLFASNLIWAAHYVEADRAGILHRKSKARVLEEANQLREAFLRRHADVEGGHAPPCSDHLEC
jgi:hypothetical protein